MLELLRNFLGEWGGLNSLPKQYLNTNILRPCPMLPPKQEYILGAVEEERGKWDPQLPPRHTTWPRQITHPFGGHHMRQELPPASWVEGKRDKARKQAPHKDTSQRLISSPAPAPHSPNRQKSLYLLPANPVSSVAQAVLKVQDSNLVDDVCCGGSLQFYTVGVTFFKNF